MGPAAGADREAPVHVPVLFGAMDGRRDGRQVQQVPGGRSAIDSAAVSGDLPQQCFGRRPVGCFVFDSSQRNECQCVDLR